MSPIAAKGASALSGAQKSAVLCMALGPEGAARILKQLSPEDVERVSREIATMEAVEPAVVEAVVREFQESARTTKPAARGGEAYARQVLEQALGGSRAVQVMERIRERDGVLARIRNAPPLLLAGILRDEHPQTIAMLLSHLDTAQAANVIEALDRTLAGEVLFRMARMGETSPEVLALIEKGLRGKADLSGAREAASAGGPSAVARLLNLTRGKLGDDLLGMIGERDGSVADAVKKQMFVLEDLLLIDGRGIQRILREIETKELAYALKAASEELKAHIRANMSSRAGDALEEEMEMMGPVRVSEVEAAHGRIIDAVKQLEDAGEIMIAGRGGSDEAFI